MTKYELTEQLSSSNADSPFRLKYLQNPDIYCLKVMDLKEQRKEETHFLMTHEKERNHNGIQKIFRKRKLPKHYILEFIEIEEY